LEEGAPKLNSEGATVGGWLTRVLAADINTYGLGGDSYLQVKPKDRKIIIGPKRVWPLSYASERFPYLKQELSMIINDKRELLFNQPTDCFVYLKEPDKNMKLSQSETQALKILRGGPHSLYFLARLMEKDPNFVPVQNLENLGVIARISMTPSDVLHYLGYFEQWDKEAAQIGMQMLANQINLQPDKMAGRLMEAIVNKLCLAVLQTLVKAEGYSEVLDGARGANVFLDKILGQGKDLFSCQVSIPAPIVAIGAPVEAYLPDAAKKLNCPLIIPEHAEVANAVGAATGKVVETIRCLIKPGGDGGFIVHLPWERKAFLDLEDASYYGMQEAVKHAQINAKKAGAGDVEIITEKEDIYGKIHANWGDEVYLETVIMVTAVGRPKWEEYNA